MDQAIDKRSILLVEDNPDDELLTLRALKKSKVDSPVTVARDGQEAIDFLFDEANALPALVLLDINLPKLSGLDVLRLLRADMRTSLLPVVMLTSSRQESDLFAGYNLGCNSYICKPVAFDKYVDVVGQLGLYWLLYNELPPPVAPAPVVP